MNSAIDDFWKWIDIKRVEKGIGSLRKLELASGHSVGAIGKRINNNQLPTTEMAMALCETLGVSWVELWSRAGVIAPEDPSGIVDIYKQLDKQGQREAVALIRALRDTRTNCKT